MRRIILASLAASLLVFAVNADAAKSLKSSKAPSASKPQPALIDVMTQNQYIGADIAPLIGAIGTDGFNDAVITALEQVSANRTADRVAKLASQISGRKPHLVGLQEVWTLTCIPALPQLGGYPCNDPSISNGFGDHLTMTMAALGNTYKVAAVVQNFTVNSYEDPDTHDVYPGIPFFLNGVPAFLQVMDNDVILARSDVPATPYEYPCSKPSMNGCNYVVDLPLGALGSVRRGFVAVDATVNGTPYRFVNTHLEVEAGGGIPGEVQAAQANQLLTTVLGSTPGNLKLILVGDFNSSPNDAASSLPTPYTQLTLAGLYDGWLLRPGNVAGLSCCQLEDLSNRVSLLTRRIDLIFSREMPGRVNDARLIGEVAADRLAPPGRGLWPSDHSSVAAGLQY
jgi:hypothetical protein